MTSCPVCDIIERTGHQSAVRHASVSWTLLGNLGCWTGSWRRLRSWTPRRVLNWIHTNEFQRLQVWPNHLWQIECARLIGDITATVRGYLSSRSLIRRCAHNQKLLQLQNGKRYNESAIRPSLWNCGCWRERWRHFWSQTLQRPAAKVTFQLQWKNGKASATSQQLELESRYANWSQDKPWSLYRMVVSSHMLDVCYRSTYFHVQFDNK